MALNDALQDNSFLSIYLNYLLSNGIGIGMADSVPCDVVGISRLKRMNCEIQDFDAEGGDKHYNYRILDTYLTDMCGKFRLAVIPHKNRDGSSGFIRIIYRVKR